MIHSVEEKSNGIRCLFNPSIGINFQGANISSDTGILILREIDESFGIISALEGILQDSRIESHTQHSCTDLSVNVFSKSQQVIETGMTSMSIAVIRPFVSLWTKTLMWQKKSVTLVKI